MGEQKKEEMKELVGLIKETESMDKYEKQYWFDILLHMTEKQTDTLLDILRTEKNKLEELEAEYNAEIKKIETEHAEIWNGFQNA